MEKCKSPLHIKDSLVKIDFVAGTIIPMSGVRENVLPFPLSRIVPLLTCSVLSVALRNFRIFSQHFKTGSCQLSFMFPHYIGDTVWCSGKEHKSETTMAEFQVLVQIIFWALVSSSIK